MGSFLFIRTSGVDIVNAFYIYSGFYLDFYSRYENFFEIFFCRLGEAILNLDFGGKMWYD